MVPLIPLIPLIPALHNINNCIRKLTDDKLEALGPSAWGGAVVLRDVLHAEAAPGPTPGAPAEQAHARAPRRPEMMPFPKCGPTRYPDLEGWDPYKTGLGLRATPEVAAQAVAVLNKC